MTGKSARHNKIIIKNVQRIECVWRFIRCAFLGCLMMAKTMARNECHFLASPFFAPISPVREFTFTQSYPLHLIIRFAPIDSLYISIKWHRKQLVHVPAEKRIASALFSGPMVPRFRKCNLKSDWNLIKTSVVNESCFIWRLWGELTKSGERGKCCYPPLAIPFASNRNVRQQI